MRYTNGHGRDRVEDLMIAVIGLLTVIQIVGLVLMAALATA